MSGRVDRLKGTGNELKGKLKQDIGIDTNNPDLVAEGETDEGKAQQVVGTVKDAARDIAKTVKR